jgi:dihydroorotate dehydrogenase (fumarate)
MDLTTNYLGMTLKNPLVPSASPLSRSLETARLMEDSGAGAIIMYSLFEEAVTRENAAMERFLHGVTEGTEVPGDKSGEPMDFPGELDRYLEQVAALKATLEIPVIASLNCVRGGGWMNHATEIADAGADALELNVYFLAGDIGKPGASVEQRYVDVLRELNKRVSIPVNMKLTPSFSSVGNMVKQLEAAGAAGVSLFNRYYQPDIDIDKLRLSKHLRPSTSGEVLLPMMWMALLYGRTSLSLGATSGVHEVEDVVKLLLAGADVVHLCSLLMEKGPQQLRPLLGELELWMKRQGFESISDVRGRLSQLNVNDPAGFERCNYLRVLESFNSGDSP